MTVATRVKKNSFELKITTGSWTRTVLRSALGKLLCQILKEIRTEDTLRILSIGNRIKNTFTTALISIYSKSIRARTPLF